MNVDESTPIGELDSLEAIGQAMSESPQSETDEDTEEEEESSQEAEGEEEESEQEEESDEDEEDKDPLIEIDGVTLRKSEWKAGHLKDADYRRKTTEAAEAKREAQAIAERAQMERSHYANHLDVVLPRLQAQLIGDQAELAKLAREDPAAWVSRNAEFQERFADYQTALQERQAIEQRRQQDEQVRNIEYVREQQQVLAEKLPEWRDPQVKAKEAQGIAEFLLTRGYTEADLDTLQDARALLIVRDAWKATQAANARASAQAKQVKPQPGAVIKPGAARTVKPNLALKDAQTRLQRDPDSLEALGAYVHASRKR